MDGENGQIKKFGKFELDSSRKILRHNGEIVPMPLKEIEILCLLIENQGELVTKQELLDKIWADNFVEEGNLSRHIYLLRKTFINLGERKELIENIARRGYRFTGQIYQHGNDELIVENSPILQPPIEDNSKIQEINQNINLFQSKRLTPVFKKIAFAACFIALFFGTTALIFHTNKSGISATVPNSIKSIAVLPLKPFSNQNADEELSLRITDALITKLGKLEEVSVRPTNSVLEFTKEEINAVEAGQKLGVDAVLDGRMQIEGKRLRVTLQLVSVSTGEQLWAEQFDGKLNEILDLQDKISTQLLPELSSKRLPPAQHSTVNAAAYEHFLRGRYFWNKRTAENYQKAIAEYQKAIEIDSQYALAHAGLADVFVLLALQHSGAKRDELYQKAKISALRALELDSDLAEPHITLGWIARIVEWNWEKSEREFLRAIELNPNSVDAHQWYALLLATVGRNDQALAEIRRAQELDPLSTTVTFNSAAVHFARREFEAAIVQAGKSLEIDSKNAQNQRSLIWAYIYSGKNIEALNFIKQIYAIGEAPTNIKAAYICASYKEKQFADADVVLQNLEDSVKNNKNIGITNLARAYTCAGRNAEALAVLQQSFELRDERLMWIKSDPVFDSLRGDQKFQDILQKMNLQ